MAHLARREIIRDFLYLSGTRAVSLVIGFIRSIFIPGLLGPSVYGMWKSFGIVQSYIQFSDLGALASLKRQVPLHRSSGNEAGLREARDTAFLVNHVVLLLGAAGLLVASFLVTDPVYRDGLRLYILLLYAIHIHTFLEQLLYWHKQFPGASKINLGLAIVEAGLAIAGTYLYGMNGLIIGTFIGYAGAVLFQLKLIRFEIGFLFKWSTYVELVKIGFPSHVNGLLYNLMMSVDRVLILPILGLEALGIYGLGLTLNEYLFQFAYSLGNAISPRLVERWNESGSMESLKPVIEKSTQAIAVASPAVLGCVYFAAPAMIEMVLPDFTPGILPLRILLLGTYFSSLHRGLSSFFLTIRKQARLFPAYGGAIGLNAGLVWLVLQLGGGISGVAATTSAVMAIFSLTLIVMARQFFVSGILAHASFLARLIVPLIWGLVAVFAGVQAADWLAISHPIWSAAVGVAGFSLCYAPLLYVAYRRFRQTLG
jgi:O-antigen/teichoic acid export membrane protein